MKLPPQRKYPALYEKVIPASLGVIAGVVVLLLVITVGVILGWLAG
ncbi:MAG: hypothetical protein ABIJ39_03270 [Chloroflexota bacterium]